MKHSLQKILSVVFGSFSAKKETPLAQEKTPRVLYVCHKGRIIYFDVRGSRYDDSMLVLLHDAIEQHLKKKNVPYDFGSIIRPAYVANTETTIFLAPILDNDEFYKEVFLAIELWAKENVFDVRKIPDYDTFRSLAIDRSTPEPR